MILEQIIADNRQELESTKRTVPLADLQKLIQKQSPPLDFAAALRGEKIRLIAEVKRASPSRGIIRQDFNPAAIAHTYADHCAAAISVLTERHYFQGKLEYLTHIRAALGDKRLPLLRKDFIYDPYQIYESRAYGADALLLIAAMLTRDQLDSLLELSHELGMKCLVEVHNEAELAVALGTTAEIIGINNRDLRTFRVDITTTERLRRLIPLDRIVVSESGIRNRSDIRRLEGLGVHAVLIGEAFMSAPDINAKMEEML